MSRRRVLPQEVRDKTHNSFKEVEPLTPQQVIDYLTDKGCVVEYTGTKSKHFKVTGKVRVVNYYGTTGTVHANPVKDKFPQYVQRGMEQMRALERVVGLANVGY